MTEAAGTVEIDEQPVTEKPRRNWWKFAGKALLFVLLGLILLIGAVMLGINTDPGRKFVAEQIEALEFENGMAIGIEEIDGSLYSEMKIRGLTVSDPQGVFFRSPEVVMDWHPFAFVSSHIDIDALTAETMVLERLPEFNEVPPTDDPLLPDYDIDIDKLEVGEFIIEAPVSGERRVATLNGDVHIADARAKVNVNGGTVIGTGQAGGDQFALILDAVPDQNQLDLDLDLQAPGDGVIAALAGLTEPLDVKLKGAGDWATWNGTLDAVLGGSPVADLDLTARDGTFGFAGETRLGKFAPASTAALLGEVTNVDITTALDERRAAISGRIFSDAFNLTANGDVDLAESNF